MLSSICRYTLTYTPSLDHLPSPSDLHVKVKNTSAIPLRAAYLHGPYTLYAACYPSTFDPNHKDESPRQDGTPDFEPNLKAGGSWVSCLTVPENIRESPDKANTKRTLDGGIPSCTWIIEVSSQVIFSTSATVHFELLVGRDEKSIDLGLSALAGQTAAAPGQLQDHQKLRHLKIRDGVARPKGVFSKAVKLEVDDTESLWNKPAFPEWSDDGNDRREDDHDKEEEKVLSMTSPKSHTGIDGQHSLESSSSRKRKRVHLVIVTHGLHSNLGSDMLYIKESIDAAAKQARLDSKKRKEKSKSATMPNVMDRGREEHDDGTPNAHAGKASTAPPAGNREDVSSQADIDFEDDEEVIVRGFSGNVVRTERGIQYLGKRLAKYVLSMTYPDQPFLPIKKSVSKSLARAFTGQQPPDSHGGLPAHLHSSIHRGSKNPKNLAYKITSISFIAHSLGGLTQTYAIAYIQKHSPHFFQEIKPINFVAMATPLLGLSNENPLYVKFALDFGLVGRTGQDLGLSWRAPAMVRSGWDAMIGGIGSEGQKALRHPDPSSKPLIRILPTGPAQQVLKLFRNRTVYSNVVNDGIVPLRTSCLLFLDWSGLGRVEKARRENGIVGTMAGWGWAELTGANSSSHRNRRQRPDDDARSQTSRSSMETRSASEHEGDVPQPSESAVKDDQSVGDADTPKDHQFLDGQGERFHNEALDSSKARNSSPAQPANLVSGFFSFLRPSQPKPKIRRQSPKHTKIYTRSQTLNPDSADGGSRSSGSTSEIDSSQTPRLGVVRGDSILEDSKNVFTPPRTSIFESAGDILNPPLPSKEFIINPESRPRTIFHDRVYHPEDIPVPSVKKRNALTRTFSSESKPASSSSDTENGNKEPTKSGMKVEEKIARAYHNEMSWRKVLVRLEPDAHNNICVRRMFANAYGWPVVKHLVDTHFSDSFVANTADEDEPNKERAKPMGESVGADGEEVELAPHGIEFRRTDSEIHEAKDNISDLTSLQNSNMSSKTGRPRLTHQDSAQWDDALFDITDDDSEAEDLSPQRSMETSAHQGSDRDSAKGTSIAEIDAFLHTGPKQEATHSPAAATQRKLDAGDLHAESEASIDLGDDNNKKPLVIRGGTTSVGLGQSVEEQLSKIAGVGNRAGEDDEGVIASDE